MADLFDFAEIMAICMEDGFDDLDAPVMRVTDEDVPLPYAANLEKLALINAGRRREGRSGKSAIVKTIGSAGEGDIALVRHYWPLQLRPAFDALMAIDDAFADIVATSSEPDPRRYSAGLVA